MTFSLAHLRFPEAASSGRRYPESPHPYRSEFERDRDRIIHARAFRRLQNKTQVFAAGISDHFRDRLTHTLEVTQIARTVARALGLDEPLTEALALAHDIGHPPFAHAGEQELDRVMRRFGDRFDHNLHALRIVESFEQRYARFPGLNLMFEVREGIAKHSRDIEPGEMAELDEYLPGLRPPLEAQIIDLADEIAYNTADLDDAHAAAMLETAEVAQAVPGFAGIYEAVEQQFPAASDRIRFLECVRRLIDHLTTGLLEGTCERVRRAGVRDVSDVRQHPERLVAFEETARDTGAGLKRLLRARVYNAPALVEERRRSTQHITTLFDLFLADPGRMPEPHATLAAWHPPHRVVCDYIAGMTDRYFHKTYRELTGE